MRAGGGGPGFAPAALVTCLALAGGLPAGPATAERRPAVVVTPGSAQTFKAAVQEFADASVPPHTAKTADFRNALSEALAYSDSFEIIDPTAFLGPDRTGDFGADSHLACSDWTTIGADAFVEGEIEVSASHFAVEFRVWDTVRCVRLLRKRYRQDAREAPEVLAKRIADDVVAVFIGVRGVSSTEIAFVSDRSGNKEIYVMDADGGRQRPVTANHSINNFPAWSPDGDSILYMSYLHRNQPTLFLKTRGVAGAKRILASLKPERSQYRGAFDPLGKYLAVVMSSGLPSEIYVVQRDSRRLRRITKNREIDVSPSWSPDGKRIAFVSDRSGSPQVYVMSARGKDVHRLTFNGNYNANPAWSPDGQWIAYETRVEGQFDIWLIDPEGTVNVPLITHPRSDEGPTWAPNSRKLAFSSTRRGRADIYAIDIHGGTPLRLTTGSGNNTSPAWGPFPR